MIRSISADTADLGYRYLGKPNLNLAALPDLQLRPAVMYTSSARRLVVSCMLESLQILGLTYLGSEVVIIRPGALHLSSAPQLKQLLVSEALSLAGIMLLACCRG